MISQGYLSLMDELFFEAIEAFKEMIVKDIEEKQLSITVDDLREDIEQMKEYWLTTRAFHANNK